jgi:acetylornithine deacetylase/succinyl-diaminopimelate desuccinylase-like protein
MTINNAGNKENMLPGRADATVNFRILPGDSVAAVTKHVETTAALPGLQLKVLTNMTEPSKVAPPDSTSFKLIERTVRELFPGTLVAPGWWSAVPIRSTSASSPTTSTSPRRCVPSRRTCRVFTAPTSASPSPTWSS